jgi:4-hydroxybenzoate polyprenyltransferase
MPNRWWVYQRERFPVFAHGFLIAAFSSSALSYSALLRAGAGPTAIPGFFPYLVAFVSCFLFFLQLRIADEFKDFEEDSRYRPYRPVPRGLIQLRELGVVFILAALVQAGLAVWLKPSMILWLALVWVYLALMSREFFVREWLKDRPITYMWSHMLIMPLIDFYATACDWWLAGAEPPEGLGWFLAVSFCNGIVLEIGRKIRAPKDEEAGVNTYSHLWGRGPAVLAWWGALAVTAACAFMAAVRIRFAMPAAVLLGLLLLGTGLAAVTFLRQPETRSAKRLENLSGLWTLLMYLSLGVVPLGWRLVGVSQ